MHPNLPDHLERDDSILPLIYFATADRAHFPIKIGRSTTAAIHDRLSTLQTGMPYRLHFMLVCHAEPSQEKAIHRSFASTRLDGEWFKRTRDMLDFIKAVEAECPDWRNLLEPRFKLTELGEQMEREEQAQEQRRLDLMREAMNAADAVYRRLPSLPNP